MQHKWNNEDYEFELDRNVVRWRKPGATEWNFSTVVRSFSEIMMNREVLRLAQERDELKDENEFRKVQHADLLNINNFLRGQLAAIIREIGYTTACKDNETLRDLVDGVAAGSEAAESATCVWTEDDDGVWETSCGEAFVFTDGGPKENRVRFCCYCGKALQEVKQDGLNESEEDA